MSCAISREWSWRPSLERTPGYASSGTIPYCFQIRGRAFDSDPSSIRESPRSRTKRRIFSTYSQYTVQISESLTFCPVSL